MKRNLSTPFVLMLGLIVMFVWLGGSGCKGSISNPPAAQTPADPPPVDPPPVDPPPVVQPTPAQITVSSRQIANGDVILNNISDQTVSIQNSGSGSLNIGQIAQANPLASPFSIVHDNCSGQAVQPSATCSFSVQFSPISQGTFTDNFDIPSDAVNENSVTVDVTGNGKALRVAINEAKTDGCPALELIVNVNDYNNTPLSGLAPGDFQLKENGVSQTIETVSQVTTTVPVSVALLLDYTGSMQSQIPTVEAASINFTGYLNPEDEAAVIKFGEFPQLMVGFTNNTADLITAIHTAPTQIGSAGTYLYDSLWDAVDRTAAQLKHKAVVLVSDGKDENYLGIPDVSIKTPDEVIAYARENDVAIYTVGLGDVDGGVMNRLASETGGQYYYITSADQLTGVYQAISNILFGQYSIKYFSSVTGGIPIMLEIYVAGSAGEGVVVGQFTGCL